MNRAEKAAEIENLKEAFTNSRFAVLTDYKGLSVSAVTELRQKLRGESSGFKVVKNRLAKIALKDTPFSDLEDQFSGTTAMAYTSGDSPGVAKILTNFAKDNEALELRSGFLNGKVLDLNEIKALANMPSKEELIAKLLSSMNAPASNLVSVLAQVPRQFVQVLAAVKDKKEQEA